MENNSWWQPGEEEPVMDFSSEKTKKPNHPWYEEEPVMDFTPRREEEK